MNIQGKVVDGIMMLDFGSTEEAKKFLTWAQKFLSHVSFDVEVVEQEAGKFEENRKAGKASEVARKQTPQLKPPTTKKAKIHE